LPLPGNCDSHIIYTKPVENIIQATDLVKKYGTLAAIDHVSFQVKRGECVGLLGPNGAGKTTLLNMIFGFASITQGELKLFGLSVANDLRQIKKRIGVVPQETSLDSDLGVLQGLLMYAHYFDIPANEARLRAKELLEFFRLTDKANSNITSLSGGMKQRLLIARALINRPEILILDEPTTGLDPQSRHLVWDRLKSLHQEGMTTLLTTHNMEEAETICDRILVIDFGKVIEQGAPLELIEKAGVKNLEEVFLNLTGRDLRD
jgi:lipooligosaccharide transport system ATP-binding protein